MTVKVTRSPKITIELTPEEAAPLTALLNVVDTSAGDPLYDLWNELTEIDVVVDLYPDYHVSEASITVSRDENEDDE